MSDTNRERLVFLLFGSYWIRTCFFENRRRHCCLQLILERNHVVFLAFLFSCQRTDLAKGRLDCQTLPSVSSGMFPCSARRFASRANPFRLTRTPIPHWCCWIEKIELPEDCRDRGVYVPPFALSTIASGTLITPDRPSLFQPACPLLKDRGVSAGTCANASRRLPIPGQPCTTCCACCGYGSVVRELLPALGPVTTAGRGVLFPDFGKMSATAAMSVKASDP
jgi:hypothetical protein